MNSAISVSCIATRHQSRSTGGQAAPILQASTDPKFCILVGTLSDKKCTNIQDIPTKVLREKIFHGYPHPHQPPTGSEVSPTAGTHTSKYNIRGGEPVLIFSEALQTKSCSYEIVFMNWQQTMDKYSKHQDSTQRNIMKLATAHTVQHGHSPITINFLDFSR